MAEYKKLDLSKLNFSDTPITTEEALSDVEPFEIPDSFISGGKQIKVHSAEKDYENRCVKLEISF